ncbi:MAG: hypothetical protein OEL56_07470 [Nitrosopumilus sp.]|nr:hypothetical protein [Nitrosopumilus sp.]MDH3517012.1 hypothetical protein [Nitrosopumilus sp.]MDH3565615.1 hypothetical protein [Nitrosopumilus sp.]MDH5416568.1 hypothetical protein [Nitrosopumilus sp.]MDH5555168.1 hypothetical protein [Nitrosopumilus sp.]
MKHTVLQYYCQNCNNILKESDSDLDFRGGVTAEPCPYCDMPLRDTLQKRPKIQPLISSSVLIYHQSKSQKTIFQKASSIPKLTLGIQKIDSVLHFLSTNQIACISGVHTQKIIERLCVRAQMPARYGGFDASHALLIDGANSSDIYQCTEFAKLYGMNVNKVLQNIISSRAFTVYQLADLITNELAQAVRQYNTKIVILSDLLYFFTNKDSAYLEEQEMKLIIKQIILSLQQIKKECLVIVSLENKNTEKNTRAYQYEKFLDRLFSMKLYIKAEHDNTLSIHITTNNNYNKINQQMITLDRKELETITQLTSIDDNIYNNNNNHI